jgi:hypothetical protein
LKIATLLLALAAMALLAACSSQPREFAGATSPTSENITLVTRPGNLLYPELSDQQLVERLDATQEGFTSLENTPFQLVNTSPANLDAQLRSSLPSYIPAGFMLDKGLASVIYNSQIENDKGQLLVLQVRNQENDLLRLEVDRYGSGQHGMPVSSEEGAVQEVTLSDGKPAYIMNGVWRVRRGGDGEITFRGWWTWGVKRMMFVRDGWLYQIHTYSTPERAEQYQPELIAIAESWLDALAGGTE